MSRHWKLFAALFLTLELALHSVCSAQIANVETTSWSVAESSSSAHRTRWRQADTVIRDYLLTTDGSTPLDLSPTNVVVQWDVMAYTNIEEQWISSTGIVVNGTAGHVRVYLSPTESNLQTGYYWGFVAALQVASTNTTNRLCTVPQVIEVRYSPDSRYTTFRGPLTYTVPTIDTNYVAEIAATIAEEIFALEIADILADFSTTEQIVSNFVAASQMGDGATWDGTNWTFGVSTNTIDSLARAWIVAVSNTADAAAATGSVAMTRANDAYDLAATMSTQGHTHVVADIADFPSTWAWANLTDTPITLGGYGITDAWTRAESDGRYLQAGAVGTSTNLSEYNNDLVIAGGVTNLTDLSSAGETDTNLVARPDGAGGVEWGSVAAGEGGIDPVIASNSFVNKSGDTMTGVVVVSNEVICSLGGTNLLISAPDTNATIRIGAGTSSTTGPLYPSVIIGNGASAYRQSVAIGNYAVGAANGLRNLAIGDRAASASGSDGTAIGASADAPSAGVAVGSGAKGGTAGMTGGYLANGQRYAVSLGAYSSAGPTNIAIGAYATASGGVNRITIGSGTTNTVDDSAVIRGGLYLDGGTNIAMRPSHGLGAWVQLQTDGTNLYFVNTTGGIAQVTGL